MRRIFSRIGTAATLLLVLGRTAQADDLVPLPATPIDPPKSLVCVSEKRCDRDPQHLADFIAGFYQWYVDRTAREDDLRFLPHDEEYRQFDIMQKAEHREMKRLLTPSYYRQFIYREWIEYDGERQTSLCDDPDGDTLFCTDPPARWLGLVRSNIVVRSGPVADARIRLPSYQAIGGPITDGYFLKMKLVPSNGLWKIQRITSDDK